MVEAAGVELDIRSGTGLISRFPRETNRSNPSIRSNTLVQVQNRYTISVMRGAERDTTSCPDPPVSVPRCRNGWNGEAAAAIEPQCAVSRLDVW